MSTPGQITEVTTEEARNYLTVALDYGDLETALRMAGLLKDHVGCMKVNQMLMHAEGTPTVIKAMHKLGVRVGADAKLHDIPKTVRGATKAIAAMEGVKWLNFHASGGIDMIRAIVEARDQVNPACGLFGVTQLTSIDKVDGPLIYGDSTPGTVVKLARYCVLGGANGVISSAEELPYMTQRVELKGLGFITPGIRPAGTSADDQKRIATPNWAIKNGAIEIVVGRPITEADDPVAAADAIVEEIRQGLIELRAAA